MKPLSVLLLIILISLHSPAQEKSPIKFGKISPEDFKTTVYSIDSNANAVVIADMGSSAIVGNRKGWFSLEYKHFKRIHILNKNGYDIAEVEIPLYTNGQMEEELVNLKAYTYNLENGKVVETKLEVKSSVFKDKVSKYKIVKKFTFPNIKEGSIIEFEYLVTSDFLFNLQPWEFQGAYPRLWSEYNISIPEFLYYVFISQGSLPMSKSQKTRQEQYRITDSRGSGASENFSFTAGVTDHRLVMKNIPALKEESFTSTINNHISKIEFQLAEYRHPLTQKNVMGNWVDVCKSLLKDEDFGMQLDRDNGWLAGDVTTATLQAGTALEKARAIFAYVQKNMTCTNYNSTYLLQPFKNILKNKNGNVAEINLLLVAMLRRAGLQAEPVILSTKSHGYAYAFYPILDRFNYVICRTVIDGRNYYLDASRTGLGFDRLSWNCYNGHARVINETATPLEFTSDSLRERKLTWVHIVNDEKGNATGTVQQTPGYYESYSIREKVKEKGKDDFFKAIAKEFGTDIEISNPKIDSLDVPDESVKLVYDFKLNIEQGEIIYVNPMFSEGYKENPFKSVTRTYPVEMPFTFDETYVFSMSVPEGYAVDELPKSIRVNFDEQGTSYFEYIISESAGTISLRSRIKMTRSYFVPDEYEILREFYSLIVKKHGEQIVFKKKK